MPLRDEILAVIEASGAVLPDDVGDHTPLIRSGIVDSTALFDLALWIEQRVGFELDPAAFDFADEWDTVARIAAFLERHAAGKPPMR